MRRTKEEAEQTRTALLAAAEQLFLEQGVAHTTLEQIARAAGVTRGALYWHFENKAHLFHAMLEQVRLPSEQLASNLSSCCERNPRQTLQQLCVQAILSMANNPQKQRIFTILLYRCEFTEDLRHAQERHEAFVEQITTMFEKLFALAQSRGNLRPGLTPRLAAVTLHALLLGMFSDWLRNRELFDPERDTPRMIDALLDGLMQD